MLQENRMLKRRLKAEDMQKLVPKDEWDGWGESVVNSHYQKYVFGSRL